MFGRKLSGKRYFGYSSTVFAVKKKENLKPTNKLVKNNDVLAIYVTRKIKTPPWVFILNDFLKHLKLFITVGYSRQFYYQNRG